MIKIPMLFFPVMSHNYYHITKKRTSMLPGYLTAKECWREIEKDLEKWLGMASS